MSYFKDGVPDADALMNPTERLEYEETGVLNKILQASHQEEVIHKNLREEQRAQSYNNICVVPKESSEEKSR